MILSLQLCFVILAPVRLVDGRTPNQGRVEIQYSGVWGTVCNNGWDLNDARVSALECVLLQVMFVVLQHQKRSHKPEDSAQCG